MPPMGTATPGRPSPMRDAGWWPECREGPTGSTFPRMTLSSTWPRAVAPVWRDRLLGESGPPGLGSAPTGRRYQLKGFRFDGAVCGICPLRSRCVAGSSGLGRRAQLHPQSLPPTLIGGGFIAAGPGPAAE